MAPKSCKLFVYGSLLSGFHHPAYQYISEYFQFIGPARVKGLLYDMGDYPAAIPSHSEQYIKGELYELTNPESFGWVIGQLDDYEGVDAGEGETPLYRRDLVTVHCMDHVAESWIYWFCGDITGKPLIASGDVLEYRKSKNH